MMIHRIYLRAAGCWSQITDHYWQLAHDSRWRSAKHLKHAALCVSAKHVEVPKE
jgi:hypothetical protein